MAYSNITIKNLFDQCVSQTPTGVPAELWVEAENLFDVRNVIIKWFYWIENNEAVNKYPDPYVVISQDEVDKLIIELEADFQLERARYGYLNVDASPGFDRLSPRARQAFVQDLYSVMKNSDEIRLEAIERLNKGEVLPPTEFAVPHNATHNNATQNYFEFEPESLYNCENLVDLYYLYG